MQYECINMTGSAAPRWMSSHYNALRALTAVRPCVGVDGGRLPSSAAHCWAIRRVEQHYTAAKDIFLPIQSSALTDAFYLHGPYRPWHCSSHSHRAALGDRNAIREHYPVICPCDLVC
ncbi:unnamed protein product [Boreogadus saida]